jgi:hypothetical protein
MASMKDMTAVIAAAALCFAGISQAAELDTTAVRDAIKTMEATVSDGWAYNRSIEHKDKVYVDAYDPTAAEGERWALQTVDGADPTDDELAEYAKRQAKRLKKSKGKDDNTWHPLNIRLTEGIDVASLKPVKTDGNQTIYAFQPEAKGFDKKKVLSKVEGHLWYAPESGLISKVEVRSTASIKPKTGVKISHYSHRATFEALGDGQYALTSFDVKVKGRLFILKKLDEKATFSFSDFEQK